MTIGEEPVFASRSKWNSRENSIIYCCSHIYSRYAVAHVGQTLSCLLSSLHQVEVWVGLLQGKNISVVALFHYDANLVPLTLQAPDDTSKLSGRRCCETQTASGRHRRVSWGTILEQNMFLRYLYMVKKTIFLAIIVPHCHLHSSATETTSDMLRPSSELIRIGRARKSW